MAARFPDRVAGLGLIDGGVGRRSGPREPWEVVRARVRPRDVSGTRDQFLDRLRHQLSICWNDQVERIVQTMVYEDEEGQIQDILRPENHLQVMHAMWEEPASALYSGISCPDGYYPGRSHTRTRGQRAGQAEAGWRRRRGGGHPPMPRVLDS